jgi:hypothetical protein
MALFAVNMEKEVLIYMHSLVMTKSSWQQVTANLEAANTTNLCTITKPEEEEVIIVIIGFAAILVGRSYKYSLCLCGEIETLLKIVYVDLLVKLLSSYASPPTRERLRRLGDYYGC